MTFHGAEPAPVDTAQFDQQLVVFSPEFYVNHIKNQDEPQECAITLAELPLDGCTDRNRQAEGRRPDGTLRADAAGICQG